MSSSSGALPQPRRGRPGPWPPAPPPQPQAPPLSWAKRTGFQSRVSGESLPSASAPTSGQVRLPRPAEAPADLESGPLARSNSALPPPPAAAAAAAAAGNAERQQPPPPPQARARRRDSDGGRPNGQAAAPSLPQLQEDEEEVPERPAHVKYELRDTPGVFPLVIYGFQHYISMIGSIILIPLAMVPAMGGTADDMAAVVSTVLLVTGMTTLLHMFIGTRLPLVQGPSFVYLAPALAIINSPEFFGLNDNNFKHIMKHLQGAIIIGGVFQVVLGYTGLMSLFLRLINPVVVSPTVAAVGLSFFSYGFTKIGTCIEMGILQLLTVVVFALYLRKIKLFGYRVLLIYAVPLGLGITWAIAFVLTATGVYSYKGCDANIPASNNVSAFCRKHVLRMTSCRVDTSHALRSSPWFRFPYPLQWGTPVFSWKMGLVMCVVSVIASVDSVGSYHASSLFVATRPPTSGVVSRGIGVEGVSTVLAGLWGTGVGSATITENVHTIAVTKMGSRRAVGFGAILLVLFSIVGKVGAFIASIPDVMVAALLCFMWAMLCALGLSNLRYSATGSFRNNTIVGLALFLSLSVPSYFQQYGVHPSANSSVPTYFQPYNVASHGPVHTGSGGVNYVLNTLLSLNMVIAFLVALVLDNTVPGGRQERGLYVWSEAEAARRESAVMKDYELPFKIGHAFRWVKCVGL
ncbi:nucleobase-ascorbate transporter 12-like isoform X1 [Phragmites australis]|uniref:nucleobase-ascorbate transporter 12-like isoform X1 n=1 Tax=Phragmites australis TaxID=29695 RepID=UPI002D7770AD|nr:nucleobase-ascorbate transporter 12-like isoform X1 [Phragmites australis]